VTAVLAIWVLLCRDVLRVGERSLSLLMMKWVAVVIKAGQYCSTECSFKFFVFLLKNIWMTILQLLDFMKNKNPLDFLSVSVD